MHIDLYKQLDGPDGGRNSVQSETVLLRKVNENLIHQHFVTLSEWAIPDLQNRFTVFLAPVCVCACVWCVVCVYGVCVCISSVCVCVCVCCGVCVCVSRVLSFRFQTLIKTLKE